MKHYRKLSTATNLDYLNKITNQDPQVLRQFFDLFIQQTQELVDQLDSHLKSENLEELAATAHKAKSSIRVLGLNEIAAALEEIELWDQRYNDGSDLAGAVEEVRTACRVVIQQLANVKDAA